MSLGWAAAGGVPGGGPGWKISVRRGRSRAGDTRSSLRVGAAVSPTRFYRTPEAAYLVIAKFAFYRSKEAQIELANVRGRKVAVSAVGQGPAPALSSVGAGAGE